MKIAYRLSLWLVFVTTLVWGTFTYTQIRSERKRLTLDLEQRAATLSATLKEPIALILKSGPRRELSGILENLSKIEQLMGAVIFYPGQIVLYETPGLDEKIMQSFFLANLKIMVDGSSGVYENFKGRHSYIYGSLILEGDRTPASLIMAHNADFIKSVHVVIIKRNLAILIVLLILIVSTGLLVIRMSFTRHVIQISDWLRQFRLGGVWKPFNFRKGTLLGILTSEISQMARSLDSARAAAAQEARLRLSSQSIWTPDKLKEHVRTELSGRPLYVVSNREPYMHVRKKDKIECIVPASGMVTALEPVMRACGGIWIAHGSGLADKEKVDAHDKVRVPPQEPHYTLKRVWLTKEDEKGYYYGFSNEGLWPLCHISHTRPIFRLDDWMYYQKVNRKFLDSLLKEIEDEDSPFILIQDYHFALLPQMIREHRPDARIAIFWHIPWPNPESFGICPWKREIILGMLSADFIGFHTQYHCNNFLDTVDDTMESKIDWENFSVQRGGHVTLVKPFPISVGKFQEVKYSGGNGKDHPKVKLRKTLQNEYGINTRTIAVGVDRLDYTKGIVERFKAVKRFLEKYPEYIGNFTFVELGAPSRTYIQKYHDFIAEVEKTAEEINWHFQSKDWKPILLLKAHHSHEDILPFYKSADICMVTSLHDGMNLVAKEFVASRDDEDGVLILSQFTGASRELRDALIINPYDIEGMADSIRTALEMHPEERAQRMRMMRAVVRERNIYLWAANLISTLSRVHSERNNAELTLK